MPSLQPAALALIAAVQLALLAACSQASDTADASRAPSKAETKAKGLRVSAARVVLPPVAGNPAAVYFDLSYSGASGVALESVAVEGAGMTMIHDYAKSGDKMQMVMTDAVALSPDARVSFKPGGLHVMAMEPSDALVAGGTAKVTLSLSDGTRVTVEAPVRAAGDER